MTTTELIFLVSIENEYFFRIYEDNPLGTHIPRTETQVKKIVSDIPPHTNQNIGIG